MGDTQEHHGHRFVHWEDASGDLEHPTAFGHDLMSLVPPAWRPWCDHVATIVAAGDPQRPVVRLQAKDHRLHVERWCNHERDVAPPDECDQFGFVPDTELAGVASGDEDRPASPAWPPRLRRQLVQLGWPDEQGITDADGSGTVRAVAAGAALAFCASGYTPTDVAVHVIETDRENASPCVPPPLAKRYALVDGASELMALGNWLEFLGADDVRTDSLNPAAVSAHLPDGRRARAQLIAHDLGAHTWSVPAPGELLVIFATPSAATDATVASLQRAGVALFGFDLRGALNPMTPAAAELCAPPMEHARLAQNAR